VRTAWASLRSRRSVPRLDPQPVDGPLGTLEAIFVTESGGVPMRRVDTVEAVAGFGLQGDRYSTHHGHWSPDDECQVTLVAGEVLDEIATVYDVAVHDGQHRRNLVTRGVDLGRVTGRSFRIGAVELTYDRPRPPCAYIASITEPAMTRALGARRGGFCARVLSGGTLHVGDPIVLRSPGA
jgi:MOSC domain-containing protein YiiM